MTPSSRLSLSFRTRRHSCQKLKAIGDIVLAVAGMEVRDLAGLVRRISTRGQAGVEVPITVYRDGETMELRVKSSERDRFLKGPSLH